MKILFDNLVSEIEFMLNNFKFKEWNEDNEIKFINELSKYMEYKEISDCPDTIIDLNYDGRFLSIKLISDIKSLDIITDFK